MNPIVIHYHPLSGGHSGWAVGGSGRPAGELAAGPHPRLPGPPQLPVHAAAPPDAAPTVLLSEWGAWAVRAGYEWVGMRSIAALHCFLSAQKEICRGVSCHVITAATKEGPCWGGASLCSRRPLCVQYTFIYIYSLGSLLPKEERNLNYSNFWILILVFKSSISFSSVI